MACAEDKSEKRKKKTPSFAPIKSSKWFAYCNHMHTSVCHFPGAHRSLPNPKRWRALSKHYTICKQVPIGGDGTAVNLLMLLLLLRWWLHKARPDIYWKLHQLDCGIQKFAPSPSVPECGEQHTALVPSYHKLWLALSHASRAASVLQPPPDPPGMENASTHVIFQPFPDSLVGWW